SIDDWSYRYVITFATRDVADTWYRAVTDSVAGGYPRFAGVKRIASQFYVHDSNVALIFETINDPKVALFLRGQMFFTLINDRDGRIQSIIPVLNYVDRINGNSYYIRSANDDSTYWYYDAGRNVVVAARDKRTKFMITNADKNRALGSVLIGSDDIYITVNNGTNIGVNSTQDFVGSSVNPQPFKLSALLSGDFQIIFNNDGFAGLGPVSRNPGKGERWELV
ncbi:hypothetical protein H0H81_009589, partial [Sphagnurus paluster]